MYQKWKDSKRHEKIKVSVHLKESSLTGYVYQLELYQEQMEKTKLNLGSSVVLLDLCQVLKDNYCHVFFDNLLIALP